MSNEPVQAAAPADKTAVRTRVTVSYNDAMERIIDKLIVLVCCLLVLMFTEQTTMFVIGVLIALAVSALQEAKVLPSKALKAVLFAYLIAAIPLQAFLLFIPLIAYDCFRMKNWLLKLCWTVPLVLGFTHLGNITIIYITLISTISCVLSWRTISQESERLFYKNLRDELRESSIVLEHKNRDLQIRQDYEVRLATLSERGRIAREIHDNVGHLLTRSVLQLEAAQVVHADDDKLKEEFEQIGNTLHEAFDTVRTSVHKLHDDSLDLSTQLYAISQNSKLDVSIANDTQDVPEELAYSFISIIKEALSNTAKHSDATKVQVLLYEYPGLWQLSIKDNGSKNPLTFSGSSARIMNNGIGLKSMEERVRGMGGVFRLDYDEGFRIFLSVPKLSEEQNR